jgi:hypothetical protein
VCDVGVAESICGIICGLGRPKRVDSNKLTETARYRDLAAEMSHLSGSRSLNRLVMSFLVFSNARLPIFSFSSLTHRRKTAAKSDK